MTTLRKLLISSLLISTVLQARDEFHDPLSYNLMFEDSLLEYEQHYGAGEDCDRHALDVYIEPLYSYKWNGAGSKSNTFGAFLKAQLNFGNFWTRFTTAFAKVNASNPTSASEDGVDGFRSSKISFDDFVLKIGYDLALTDTHYLGLYLQGGFPSHSSSHGPEVEKEMKEKKEGEETQEQITIVTTPLGTKNYTLGFGIDGGFSVFDTARHHLAFLFDARYRYAFAANYGHIADEDKTKKEKESVHSASTSSAEEEKTKKVTQEELFTPGSTINLWTAFHYRIGDFNVELGNVFNTTFGSSGRIKTKTAETTKASSVFGPEPAPAPEVIKPTITKFSANPYIAFAYTTLLADYPTIIGFGIGYTYEQESGGARVNNIITPWVSFGMSF